MRRRSGRRSAFLLVAILALMGGGLFAAATYVPPFYKQAEFESDQIEFGSESSRLMTRVNDLSNDITAKPEWGATFEARELNCFLHEYATEVNARLGGHIHTPRMSFDGDRVRLGVRSGTGLFSLIFWIELRVWLVKSEPNCLAVEISSIKAGLIPIAGQSILDRVTEAARASNVDVAWYRNNGKPVGIFRLFTDQSRRQPKQIRAVQIREGQLTIAGRTAPEGTTAPAGVDPLFGGRD